MEGQPLYIRVWNLRRIDCSGVRLIHQFYEWRSDTQETDDALKSKQFASELRYQWIRRSRRPYEPFQGDSLMIADVVLCTLYDSTLKMSVQFPPFITGRQRAHIKMCVSTFLRKSTRWNVTLFHICKFDVILCHCLRMLSVPSPLMISLMRLNVLFSLD